MEASALHAPARLARTAVRAPLLRLRSDDQLVVLFRLGNEEAFRAIHDRYRTRLLSYMRQMLSGSRSDAEDALQDVFLRAYDALRQDSRPVSLRAWLYRVAHNRCIDHLRRPAPPVVELFETSRTPVQDPSAETERREDLRRLVADVRRLPEQQRSALLMREMEGLTYQELADAMGVTLPAVKSLLVRARMGLVEAIEARDTDCGEIRRDLMASFDKGVRASGRARRHLRECSGCREFRGQLRGVRRGMAALSGGGPSTLATLAKIFGIGGASSGAAAGGGAAAGAGGGGVIAMSGSAATVTATKVAAIVCCAALTGGAAVEVRDRIAPRGGHPRPARAARAAARPAVAAVPSRPPLLRAPAARTVGTARDAPRAGARDPHGASRRHDVALTAPAVFAPAPPAPTPTTQAQPSPSAVDGSGSSGGAQAPDESTLPGPDNRAPMSEQANPNAAPTTSSATPVPATPTPTAPGTGGTSPGSGRSGTTGGAGGGSGTTGSGTTGTSGTGTTTGTGTSGTGTGTSGTAGSAWARGGR